MKPDMIEIRLHGEHVPAINTVMLAILGEPVFN